MNRMIALTIAILVLLSAGWWGWSSSDFWPQLWRRDALQVPPGLSARPPMRPVAAADPAAPMPEAVPSPPPLISPRLSVPAGAEPPLTPAPQDTPLPPETGSAAAREIETIAEVAINAADIQARAEATARTERLAHEAAQADLAAALAPVLTADDFAPTAIRARLASLPVLSDPLTARARSALADQIIAILPDEGAATEASPTAADGALTPTPSDPISYIARIKELL
ncbi:MAG: hypothetical protein ACK5LJ_09480 [Paracoccus sp. (in: a-proteobacteria)]